MKKSKVASTAIAIAVGLAIFAVAGIFMVLGGAGQPEKAVKTPEQIQADAKKEAEFQDAASKIRALKQAMKNPDSFELVQALRMPDGALCITYRATNSFNAKITEQKAISKDARLVGYSASCNGKTGHDISHVRHAI